MQTCILFSITTTVSSHCSVNYNKQGFKQYDSTPFKLSPAVHKMWLDHPSRKWNGRILTDMVYLLVARTAEGVLDRMGWVATLLATEAPLAGGVA